MCGDNQTRWVISLKHPAFPPEYFCGAAGKPWRTEANKNEVGGEKKGGEMRGKEMSLCRVKW